MDSDKKYTKLSNLIDSTFTVNEAKGYTWKRWNNDARRMETSDRFEKGFSKKYSIITDKGLLELGSGQLSSLLEAVYDKGSANINGKTFSVKSNGKTGMDIRYYFSVVRQQTFTKDTFSTDYSDVLPNDEEAEQPIPLEDIPF